MSWSPVTWERCAGMNSKAGQCKAKGKHIIHKKSWIGGWYGMLSHKDPRDQSYGKNKPTPQRKNKRGIWK